MEFSNINRQRKRWLLKKRVRIIEFKRESHWSLIRLALYEAALRMKGPFGANGTKKALWWQVESSFILYCEGGFWGKPQSEGCCLSSNLTWPVSNFGGQLVSICLNSVHTILISNSFSPFLEVFHYLPLSLSHSLFFSFPLLSRYLDSLNPHTIPTLSPSPSFFCSTLYRDKLHIQTNFSSLHLPLESRPSNHFAWLSVYRTNLKRRVLWPSLSLSDRSEHLHATDFFEKEKRK